MTWEGAPPDRAIARVARQEGGVTSAERVADGEH